MSPDIGEKYPVLRHPVADLTSEDQVTPEEDVYPPHKHGDLKSSKRKKVPEGNNSDVEPSKTKLRSGDVPKSGGQPSSSRVSFTFNGKPVKETYVSTCGNAAKAPQQSDCPSDGPRTCINVPPGPPTLTAPLLETSLVQVHQRLADICTLRHADSKKLWKEASELKEKSSRIIEKEHAVSIQSMSMKVEAAIKYLEAGNHSPNKKIVQDVMLNTGKLLFAAAEKHGGKVVGDDFTRTCFTNLAQRLGVCAHMRYYQQTKKSDVGGLNILEQAVDMAASTTKELANLREKTGLLSSSDTSIVVLIESLCRNYGLGPLEEYFYIARRALNMLMERK